jgi:flavin reductase (DIM6/NTAB) family NADH-FMN oxidoreductase RutF
MSLPQAVCELAEDVPAERFKAAMSSVCTPVSVVTAFDGTRPHGTTVSAVCSLSLRPPMVMLALDESSALLRVLRTAPCFGINILSQAQHGIARTFAVKGDNKFQNVDWVERSGAPRIVDSACWLACEAERLVPGGDHTVVLARVLETDHEDMAAPLTYHRRAFGTHAALGPVAGRTT